MRLDEPSWWYRPGRAPMIVRALRPVSAVYGWAVERRFCRTRPYRSTLPVICVGNLTAGGTGKTPFSIRLAQELLTHGERPAFLTRGYGGRFAGPHLVNPSTDVAADVGDEALLLAEAAPTVVSRDRVAGARTIETDLAATVIIMDDGLQNPSLAKDLTFALIDAGRGFGNGEVLPAGPLRARLGFQLRLVNAVIVNHPPEARGDFLPDNCLRSHFTGPVFKAAPEPQGDVAWIEGARTVAFAGIANPQRFFALLEQLGAQVAATVALPDHHAFSARDAERILGLADKHDAIPVTTEKDRVRLKGRQGAVGELLLRSRTLGIQLAVNQPDGARLDLLITDALRRARCG